MIRNFIIILVLLLLTFSLKNIEAQTRSPLETGDDLIFSVKDESKGLILGNHSVNNDNGRLSLLYHVNADLKDVTKISSFELNYAKKFDLAWLEIFVARTTINFSQMSPYNAQALKFASLDDIEAEDESILSLGVGLSYRTRYIKDLWGLDTWFESIGAFLSYYQMEENFLGEKFSGAGLKMDFGIHKRTSENFHVGGKMSYNLAPVMRADDNDFKKSDRALLLRWMSFALDLSYYF